MCIIPPCTHVAIQLWSMAPTSSGRTSPGHVWRSLLTQYCPCFGEATHQQHKCATEYLAWPTRQWKRPYCKTLRWLGQVLKMLVQRVPFRTLLVLLRPGSLFGFLSFIIYSLLFHLSRNPSPIIPSFVWHSLKSGKWEIHIEEPVCRENTRKTQNPRQTLMQASIDQCSD